MEGAPGHTLPHGGAVRSEGEPKKAELPLTQLYRSFLRGDAHKVTLQQNMQVLDV